MSLRLESGVPWFWKVTLDNEFLISLSNESLSESFCIAFLLSLDCDSLSELFSDDDDI